MHIEVLPLAVPPVAPTIRGRYKAFLPFGIMSDSGFDLDSSLGSGFIDIAKIIHSF